MCHPLGLKRELAKHKHACWLLPEQEYFKLLDFPPRWTIPLNCDLRLNALSLRLLLPEYSITAMGDSNRRDPEVSPPSSGLSPTITLS